MKTIQVVAAIIHDAAGRIFATQRGYGEWQHYWEFPGGKIEAGETAEQALHREIWEELKTRIVVERLMETVDWDYPTFHLTMHCYWCRVASGSLTLVEHEAARWLAPAELDGVKWLPADKGLIERLQRSGVTRILFVCHGNICRSPMAEFVMKDLVARAGREAEFYIESAATSTEEIGNPVYPPARRKLGEHGIDCRGKTARQLRRDDYQRFDLLIGMDQWNLRNMSRIVGDDPERKIHLLMDYTSRPGSEVADPWYTGDFEATWRDVLEGCTGLLTILPKFS